MCIISKVLIRIWFVIDWWLHGWFGWFGDERSGGGDVEKLDAINDGLVIRVDGPIDRPASPIWPLSRLFFDTSDFPTTIWIFTKNQKVYIARILYTL